MTDSEIQQNYMKVNLSFWRPLAIGSIRGSIKRSPIVENSLCPFSQMQHWSVYLTMSHESNWHLSEWTISVCFDSETAEWSSAEELKQYCQMSDGLFSISPKGYFIKYWKSWAWWKYDMASINLSKFQT